MITYIGIDPDVTASGFAIATAGKITLLTTLDLVDTFNKIKECHDNGKVLVRLEAGWLIKGNWHKGGSKKSGNAVGRNHEIGRQIEKFCIKHDIKYQLVLPQGYSSYTHDHFCKITGWPKSKQTNSEKRVAAMMVYIFL